MYSHVSCTLGSSFVAGETVQPMLFSIRQSLKHREATCSQACSISQTWSRGALRPREESTTWGKVSKKEMGVGLIMPIPASTHQFGRGQLAHDSWQLKERVLQFRFHCLRSTCVADLTTKPSRMPHGDSRRNGILDGQEPLQYMQHESG